MGCTESLPVANSFEAPHKLDPTVQPLGSNHGAGPSQVKQELIVREKLFSWSGDSFKIKKRDGRPFGNNLFIRGKVFAFRDQMVLEDGMTGEPIAICLRKFEMIGQTFKIYTTQPNFPGQRPSDRKHNNTPLYTYARVERVPFSTEQRVFMEQAHQHSSQQLPSYTVNRAGSMWPKKRTVRRQGQPAAFMEGGTWEGNWNSYLITVAPGIDACLMLCLSAICDEMDEDR